MIGLLAKLAKAAKLAQTAEAAIDVATNKLAPSDDRSKPEASAGDATAAATAPAAASGDVPHDYRAMLDAGARDARDLLSAADAATIIGKPIRRTTLCGTGDFLKCDYHCKDRADTVLGVHVCAAVPWEVFDTEIEKMEIFDDLGEAAFRGDRQIYVKAGDTIFRIHTAGEITVKMALKAAGLVVGRLADAEAAQPSGDS